MVASEQTDERRVLPEWLRASEAYEPPRDRDAYLTRSLLSVASVLARLRLGGGAPTLLSPSPVTKLLLGLGCVLLVSLSHNYAFVAVMLALALARVALLPADALRRAMGTACGAALASALVMLPAVLIGQGRQVPVIATKVLVSVMIVLCVSLTTRPGDLASALRSLRVPSLVILTFELAIKGIVSLGATALEVLDALRLRSIGHDARKVASLGGVGGVLFVKAGRQAEDTFAAMRCRGFEGDYPLPRDRSWRPVDLAWAAGFAVLVALFAYLQKAV